MHTIDIVQLPKKVLRKKSTDVKIPLDKENIELAEKMIFHIDESQKEGSKYRAGVGVAAVQYGTLKNVFYVHVKNWEKDIELFRDVLFNPKIISKSDTLVALESGEGCLSVSEDWPKQEGFVPRSARIIVEAYSYFKKEIIRFDVSGYVAIVFQHELDHLDGKLFIDRINKKNPWQKTEETILI